MKTTAETIDTLLNKVASDWADTEAKKAALDHALNTMALVVASEQPKLAEYLRATARPVAV